MVVGPQFHTVACHEVHGSLAGFPLVALLVDHHAHLHAAIPGVNQGLHDVGGLERVGEHLDAVPGVANRPQDQLARRAFRRKADLYAGFRMGKGCNAEQGRQCDASHYLHASRPWCAQEAGCSPTCLRNSIGS
ncbi:hypothetical protein D3C72_1646470 [compost metagenome]